VFGDGDSAFPGVEECSPVPLKIHVTLEAKHNGETVVFDQLPWTLPSDEAKAHESASSL